MGDEKVDQPEASLLGQCRKLHARLLRHQLKLNSLETACDTLPTKSYLKSSADSLLNAADMATEAKSTQDQLSSLVNELCESKQRRLLKELAKLRHVEMTSSVLSELSLLCRGPSGPGARRDIDYMLINTRLYGQGDPSTFLCKVEAKELEENVNRVEQLLIKHERLGCLMRSRQITSAECAKLRSDFEQVAASHRRTSQQYEQFFHTTQHIQEQSAKNHALKVEFLLHSLSIMKRMLSRLQSEHEAHHKANLLLHETFEKKCAGISEVLERFHAIEREIQDLLTPFEKAFPEPTQALVDFRKDLAVLAARLRDRFNILNARLGEIAKQKQELQQRIADFSVESQRLKQETEKMEDVKKTIEEFKVMVACELTKLREMNRSLVKRVEDYRNDCRRLMVDLQFLDRDMKISSLELS